MLNPLVLQFWNPSLLAQHMALWNKDYISQHPLHLGTCKKVVRPMGIFCFNALRVTFRICLQKEGAESQKIIPDKEA